MEERQRELNVTTTQPTSLAEESLVAKLIGNPICSECGGEKKLTPGLGWLICEPCAAKRKEEDKKELAETVRKARDYEENQKYRQLMATCAIGERFKGMTFDDYKPADAAAAEILEACKDYVINFTGKSCTNLLMIGSPGTGKNMLAAIICQELIKLGFPCLHSTAMKVVRKVKDSWKDKEVSEQSVINSMVEPALLVIDEVGVQFGSTTEQLYLTEIINERYEKLRPTILISNLKLSELTAIMGERIIDRFYDDGSKLLVFAWQSYRRRQRG